MLVLEVYFVQLQGDSQTQAHFPAAQFPFEHEQSSSLQQSGPHLQAPPWQHLQLQSGMMIGYFEILRRLKEEILQIS